jgi:hypothetical protein
MWIKFLEEYKEYLISTDDKWFNNFNELKGIADSYNLKKYY